MSQTLYAHMNKKKKKKISEFEKKKKVNVCLKNIPSPGVGLSPIGGCDW
jgi:hypothetical protein